MKTRRCFEGAFDAFPRPSGYAGSSKQHRALVEFCVTGEKIVTDRRLPGSWQHLPLFIAGIRAVLSSLLSRRQNFLPSEFSSSIFTHRQLHVNSPSRYFAHSLPTQHHTHAY